jgi:hypothetical protein
MIRLVCRKPQEGGKTHPTLFRVVPDADLPIADVGFGKHWLKGTPIEIENRVAGGKRKGNHGESTGRLGPYRRAEIEADRISHSYQKHMYVSSSLFPLVGEDKEPVLAVRGQSC